MSNRVKSLPLLICLLFVGANIMVDAQDSRASRDANSFNADLTPTLAEPLLEKETIGHLANELGEAYAGKTMGNLDAERPYLRRVKIVIEHSLGQAEYEVKQFTSLANAEQWLKSQERDDGTPARVAKPLLRCRKGVCSYNFEGGILHNQLYLKKFTYGFRNGNPYIKTIYLLDGD